jgi:hypothetical protein
MLYHKDIGFPESLKIPYGIVNLRYSHHARQRFKWKYREQIILPSYVRISESNVVEAGTEDGECCSKLMVRIAYDNRQDMCVVLNPYSGKVITLWINNKQDRHDLFDKTKYNQP